ncbi:Uncharacterized protein GBIM_15897 [Gryllus bimaculatus]|nr:Uncharacterized protein GBIM_15897 [Gryllus bimaculatus]
MSLRRHRRVGSRCCLVFRIPRPAASPTPTPTPSLAARVVGAGHGHGHDGRRICSLRLLPRLRYGSDEFGQESPRYASPKSAAASLYAEPYYLPVGSTLVRKSYKAKRWKRSSGGMYVKLHLP